jgi:integrase
VFALNYRAARGIILNLNAATGIAFTAHTLRHTYATRLDEAGIPPKVKQYLMGHANLNMTQNVYTDVQAEFIAEQRGSIIACFDT